MCIMFISKNQDHPQEKEMQKGKMAALQIAVKRKEAKSKGEKERYAHFNAEFQRIPVRDKKKLSSVIIAKKERKTIEW